MVWTLFDYYGEPPVGGFEVSSTYGQFDLCGFPKSSAFWFRVQWLLSIPDERADKPLPTQGKFEVHIVESWESPDSWNETKGNTTRTIHAYSNAPFIELFVNGASQGSKAVIQMVQGPGSYAEWTQVPWQAGRISAIAYDSSGVKLAKTTHTTNTRATQLVIGIDAPSDKTGTGVALLLDGQDAALVRVSVMDTNGQVTHMATNNITFSIVSGPGIIQGTSNGDPHCHGPNNAPWHSAYHGLVRAVVRVTSIRGRSVSEQAILREIDCDGPSSVSGNVFLDDDDIVVEASSPGFESVRITIPTTTEWSASVLRTAEASVDTSLDFFGTTEDNIGQILEFEQYANRQPRSNDEGNE